MASHSTIWEDSSGKAHAIPTDEPDFIKLLRDLEAWQGHKEDFYNFLETQRCVTAAARIPVNTASPRLDRKAEAISKRPHLKLAKKSFSFSKMASELTDLNKSISINSEADRARALFKSLDIAARNGQLNALQGAKVDALRNRYARSLGLEVDFLRR